MELSALLDDARERVDPRVVREELHRHDRRALGREAHAAHVRDREERLADLLDLLRAELVSVAAGDDDVLELCARRDVRVRRAPAIFADLEVHLLDLFGVDADRVAARAEAAVDRARVEREKERLVGVAVREAGHRRVALLVERVEVELRVIRKELRLERDELDAQRVLVRVLPVDEREEVRAHAHAHRRLLEALVRVFDELRRDEPLDRLQELLDVRDRVLGLPVVIEERLFVDVLVRRDALPERAVEQILVDERLRIDGGFLRDDGGMRRLHDGQRGHDPRFPTAFHGKQRA